MNSPLKLTLALLAAVAVQVPETAEAQLFGRWGWSTSYYSPYTTYYAPTYTYGYGYGYGCCAPTTCCSSCSACSTCGCNPCSCSSCGSCCPSSCSSCVACAGSSCPGGDCGIVTAGDLTPTPDSGPPPTFYDKEEESETPEEKGPFEERDVPDPGNFDLPEESGTDSTGVERETFKKPIKGEVIPQKKQPERPTIDDADEAEVFPLESERAFTWTVAPIRSRVQVRARFGNPIVARTPADPNAGWEAVPPTQIANK